MSPVEATHTCEITGVVISPVSTFFEQAPVSTPNVKKHLPVFSFLLISIVSIPLFSLNSGTVHVSKNDKSLTTLIVFFNDY